MREHQENQKETHAGPGWPRAVGREQMKELDKDLQVGVPDRLLSQTGVHSDYERPRSGPDDFSRHKKRFASLQTMPILLHNAFTTIDPATDTMPIRIASLIMVNAWASSGATGQPVILHNMRHIT